MPILDAQLKTGLNNIEERKMNRQTRLFVAACLFLLTVSQWVFAQGRSASLSGVIKDAAGAPIPGAAVIVRNPGTSQTRDAVSDEQGRYAFLSLDLGQHEVTAQKHGFKPARIAVELSIGQQAEADITLAPGEVAEGVEVKSGEQQLAVETRSSTFGQLVTRGQIENLPLNGRDFSQLILLQPGATQARSDQGDILSGKGAKISVHGARTSQNAYMLDGADILDALGRNAASAQGLVSGIESVQEFAVMTNTYSAEYGRAAGGVFNIATRSGTNQFHGTVFEFLRNSALDAANFFENANGQQKAPFKRNQFGAAGGGPIIKNKAFIFGAYEGFRERLGLTVVEDVPSLAARRGAFLPQGRAVSPAVIPYLQLIPAPTIDNPNGEKATYIGQFNQPSNLDTYNVRVDYNFSRNDSLFARYTHNDSEITFLNPETFPEFPNRGSNRQKFFTISETRVFSGALVNNIRYAFNRTSPDESPAPPNGFKDLAFIPGDLVGTIFISGFRRFGTDRNTPRSFLQNTNQLSDDLSFIKGAHLMKAGMNIEYFRISGDSASRNRGDFTINTFSDL